MTLHELFRFFWNDYTALTPSAEKIHSILAGQGEKVTNDHIAFRTFNIHPIGIESLGTPFIAAGYQPSGEYHFEQKKLRAVSYAHPEPGMPYIFISELLTEEFSSELQEIVRGLVAQVPGELAGTSDLYTALPTWKPIEYAAYQRLLQESEYAGWLSAFGIRVNHYTVSVNGLATIASLQELNELLAQHGFSLNTSGGIIKGTPEELLEQSSTIADRIAWEFAGGERHVIPSCYYEFARRYTDAATGKLYRGFIAKSADKIFESTNTQPA